MCELPAGAANDMAVQVHGHGYEQLEQNTLQGRK
jgi:hypothetical protein